MSTLLDSREAVTFDVGASYHHHVSTVLCSHNERNLSKVICLFSITAEQTMREAAWDRWTKVVISKLVNY